MRNAREVSAEQARAWRDAAIADGWACEPTYQTQPLESACTLSREGFAASISIGKREGSVWVWGPDMLQIPDHGVEYDFERLKRNLKLCDQCGQYAERCTRVGFANRVCDDCKSGAQKRIEFPGWAN